MATHQLSLNNSRPYFAEVPYYLWGQVNYDSEGDCQRPTDRAWTWLDLTNRENREHVRVSSNGDIWMIQGDEPAAQRATLFLVSRCEGKWVSPSPGDLSASWDHETARMRVARVQAEFERPELGPFDVGHLFWGSWKWIGWFATDFTWVGRWIMHSVVRHDVRAVNLCVEWLRHGTCDVKQSEALRYALHRFTGQSLPTDAGWVAWYDESGKTEYPEPDFKQWHEELKSQMSI
jgi:hypothetical protein